MPLGFVRDPHVPALRKDADEQHRMRVAREAEMIAEARAELDAGLGIEENELEAWLDRLDHDPDAPLPAPRQSADPYASGT